MWSALKILTKASSVAHRSFSKVETAGSGAEKQYLGAPGRYGADVSNSGSGAQGGVGGSIVMGLPQNRWRKKGTIPSFEMDDDWGYPYDSGNLQLTDIVWCF